MALTMLRRAKGVDLLVVSVWPVASKAVPRVRDDDGSQRVRAKESGLIPSMGSIGDCQDNAVIERFWSRMQVELLDRRRWRTRIELANATFEYLEIFHNRQRRHSALGWLTPVEFDNAATITVA